MTIYNDGTGNFFFGTLYDRESTITILKTEIGTLLSGALGATNRYSDRSINEVIDWRPNVAEELMVSTTAGSNSILINSVRPPNFARFSHLYAVQAGAISDTAYFNAIATNNDSATHTSTERIYGIPSNTNGFTSFYDGENPVWVTANNHSIASFNFNRASGNYFFNYTGVIQDFPALFGSFPRNCCALTVGKDNANNQVSDSYRVDVENGNTKQLILTSGDANYPISCDDGQTSGADLWATDLYLLDNDGANNPATGRCSNLLLAKGATFAIGSGYTLNTAHIDGGSNTFLCVGEWGTDKILMRIKS